VTVGVEEQQILDLVGVRELASTHAPRASVVDVVLPSALTPHRYAAQLAAALSAFVEGFHGQLVRSGRSAFHQRLQTIRASTKPAPKP
jgi:hypothetical protein